MMGTSKFLDFGKKIAFFTLKLILVLSLILSFIAGESEAKRKKRRGGKKKVIKLKEIVIKQRVIKPQAMIILTRSQQALVKSDIVTSQNFSNEIIKTVNEDIVK